MQARQLNSIRHTQVLKVTIRDFAVCINATVWAVFERKECCKNDKKVDKMLFDQLGPLASVLTFLE